VTYNSIFECRACYFSGGADFGFSTFSGNADFSVSTFSGKAVFRNTHWHCVVRDLVQPVPGKANFASTNWTDELLMENMDIRPGVTLDFTNAKWESIPKTEQGESKPVLYLRNANYNNFLFPVANKGIPYPLVGFGHPDSAFYRTGWRVQVPNPGWTKWPVIQRTYGKFLNSLKESGCYNDHDALFIEFHDLETHYKWYKGKYLQSTFNFTMGLICGYGIRPVRAFWFSFWVILGFAVIYWIFRRRIRPRYETDRENAFSAPYYFHRSESPPPKFRMPDELLGYNFAITHLWPKNLSQTWKAFLFIIWRIFLILHGAWLLFWYLMNFVLFSVNTFCTVGYDNNYPVKGLRYICMAELVLGYITLTLFLVSLVNVLIR